MDYKQAAKVGDWVVPRELVDTVGVTNIIFNNQLTDAAQRALCEILSLSSDHKHFSLKLLDGSDRILDSADYPLEKLVIVKQHPFIKVQGALQVPMVQHSA